MIRFNLISILFYLSFLNDEQELSVGVLMQPYYSIVSPTFN